jgi:hypothetical protein
MQQRVNELVFINISVEAKQPKMLRTSSIDEWHRFPGYVVRFCGDRGKCTAVSNKMLKISPSTWQSRHHPPEFELLQACSAR